MARRIIKKVGGDRIGSGGKMTVSMNGYGYSTHDVSKVRRTSMSFGTIVPMGQFLMTSGSRLSINLDALITSNALNYQLYGSAKFQLDVFSARMALYNPKMQINLMDQGYDVDDVKFPLMELETKGLSGVENISNQQINPSALLRYIGIAGNGQNESNALLNVTRRHNAMWLLMYYQVYKEYYANKQEKRGWMIHNAGIDGNIIPQRADFWIFENDVWFLSEFSQYSEWSDIDWFIARPETGTVEGTSKVRILYEVEDGGSQRLQPENVWYQNENNEVIPITIGFDSFTTGHDSGNIYWLEFFAKKEPNEGTTFKNPSIPADISPNNEIKITDFDLKAIDRMTMRLMANVESTNPIIIDNLTELPYGGSFQAKGSDFAVNATQEGLCLGTYQSDVFNNWLDNATINNLNNKSKIKVDNNGEFTIDMLNITQKLYNMNMRTGVTDGTLEEWREVTYGTASKGKSLKPVYEGGLSKEIVFDMVVSTASTEDEPLGSIASRGQFGRKHKGGYVQISTDEEKLVSIYAKITPRLVYNQGNDWTTNLKTLDDLHKPALDKIGYQNLITDQIAAFETKVNSNGTLTTYSAGKQPAWQWYRTNYDDALGNMASTEDYKVFGRTYEAIPEGNHYRIKDLTTYIDPTKFNDVFAIASLDAMNFDVQVGIDAKLTQVMSEEVIPGL